MVYSLPRWTLNQDRENRLNDLYRYQSEEQRAALERQGRARTKGIEATYKGISDSIDKGMEGYERGRQAKRAGEAHDKEMKLSDASLAQSEETLARNRMERGDLQADIDMKNAMRPDGMTNRQYAYNLGLKTSEESLASQKDSRDLTKAQIAAIGKEDKRLDQTKAETELNATMDTIQSLTAQRNLLENQLRGPLSEEGRAQAQAQLANTTAQINQLTLTAQALSQKAGLSEPALLVRGTQAASRFKKAQDDAATARNLTEQTKPSYMTAHAQLTKAVQDTSKLIEASGDLAAYKDAFIGTPSATNAFNKFVAKMEQISPQDAQYVRNANYIGGTPTSRMQYVLEQKKADIQASINAARAIVTAENASTLQPTIAAAEAQLRQLDQIQQKVSGGGAQNAPIQNRGAGPAVLTGGGQPPGAPPSLR